MGRVGSRLAPRISTLRRKHLITSLSLVCSSLTLGYGLPPGRSQWIVVFWISHRYIVEKILGSLDTLPCRCVILVVITGPNGGVKPCIFIFAAVQLLVDALKVK
jgi:hypothetical protein